MLERMSASGMSNEEMMNNLTKNIVSTQTKEGGSSFDPSKFDIDNDVFKEFEKLMETTKDT